MQYTWVIFKKYLASIPDKINSIIIGRIHIHLSDLTDDNTYEGLITQPPTETAGDLC